MKKMFVFLVALSMLTSIAVAKKEPSTIVDVAVKLNQEGPYVGTFDTLIAALGAADPGVIETLSGRGQYTVFAPTDAAFQELGLNESNIDSVPDLTEILMYHVTHGKRESISVLGAQQMRMLNKDFVQEDNGVLIDNTGMGAELTITDVQADNGVIHVIDSVLLP